MKKLYLMLVAMTIGGLAIIVYLEKLSIELNKQFYDENTRNILLRIWQVFFMVTIVMSIQLYKKSKTSWFHTVIKHLGLIIGYFMCTIAIVLSGLIITQKDGISPELKWWGEVLMIFITFLGGFLFITKSREAIKASHE